MQWSIRNTVKVKQELLITKTKATQIIKINK